MKKILFSLVMVCFSLGYMVAEEKVEIKNPNWNIDSDRSLSDVPQVSLSNGILSISSNGPIEHLSIRIQSMAGGMVFEQSDVTLLPGQPYFININDLPSGEYMLFLQAGSNYAIYSVTK